METRVRMRMIMREVKVRMILTKHPVSANVQLLLLPLQHNPHARLPSRMASLKKRLVATQA